MNIFTHSLVIIIARKIDIYKIKGIFLEIKNAIGYTEKVEKMKAKCNQVS